MKRRSKVLDYILLLCFFGVLAGASAWFGKQNEENLAGRVRFVDGDSLFLGTREIRLLGIDAPEFTQTCRKSDGGEYACGKDSLQHLRRLTNGNPVTCEGWEEDKYQRLLAVCSVDGIELNSKMVEDGFAVSFGDYEREEALASKAKRGLWSGEFDNPSAWRRAATEAHASGWLSKLLGL